MPAQPQLSRRGWLAVATAWAAGCTPAPPWRVGFLGGMSGRVADLGISGRNGTQLAVDAINAAGGIGGRRLELLLRDDEQKADVARQRFGELAAAGAAFVVGPMTSAMAVALAPVATERSVPLISPTATTHELSGRDDAFFRVVPEAPAGARQQAAAIRASGRRRLATLMDARNLAFAESWCRAAAQRFRDAGGEVVAELAFEGAPGLQFVELARRVLAAQPDAVVIAASAADSALLGQQIRRADAGVLLALSAWAGTEELPRLAGRALDGTVVAQYFDRESPAPAYRAFVERYRQRFGEAPGYPAVCAHDAVTLGAAALAAGGPPLAALRAVRAVDGLQRRLPIDAFGDAQAPMFLAELRDGAYASLATS